MSLETKTYLFHDLMHFAVESEATLAHGFYGRLLQGYRYEELALPEMEVSPSGGDREIAMIERVVGLLTGVLKHDASEEEAVAGLVNLLSASGEAVPTWFTAEFVRGVKARMKALLGEWNGTPFGEEMNIVFTVR